MYICVVRNLNGVKFLLLSHSPVSVFRENPALQEHVLSARVVPSTHSELGLQVTRQHGLKSVVNNNIFSAINNHNDILSTQSCNQRGTPKKIFDWEEMLQ